MSYITDVNQAQTTKESEMRRKCNNKKIYGSLKTVIRTLGHREIV